MNIKGKILVKNETIQIKETFKKREFVVLTDEKYPQKIKVELIQDNCQLLDKFNEGEFVDVKINIKGREWKNTKGELNYFISLQAWEIIKIIAVEKKEEMQKIPEDDLPF